MRELTRHAAACKAESKAVATRKPKEPAPNDRITMMRYLKGLQRLKDEEDVLKAEEERIQQEMHLLVKMDKIAKKQSMQRKKAEEAKKRHALEKEAEKGARLQRNKISVIHLQETMAATMKAPRLLATATAMIQTKIKILDAKILPEKANTENASADSEDDERLQALQKRRRGARKTQGSCPTGSTKTCSGS